MWKFIDLLQNHIFQSLVCWKTIIVVRNLIYTFVTSSIGVHSVEKLDEPFEFLALVNSSHIICHLLADYLFI